MQLFQGMDRLGTFERSNVERASSTRVEPNNAMTTGLSQIERDDFDQFFRNYFCFEHGWGREDDHRGIDVCILQAKVSDRLRRFQVMRRRACPRGCGQLAEGGRVVAKAFSVDSVN